MDFIFGMVSIVKDMNTVDKQYKNLNLQLKYTLEKATRTLNKIKTNEENLGLAVLKNNLSDGEKLSKKLDQLLNASQIAIKDKIRLSLPFNQTKPEIVRVIQTLEKVVSDFKEELSDQTKVQSRTDSKQSKEGGIKRRINQPLIVIKTVQRPKVNETQIKQIDQHLQEIYEMGPTIKQDQYHFSDSRKKQREIQFTILVHGSEEIVKILQNQQLEKSKIKFKESEIPLEKNLYTVARMNFQKCYAKIKAVTKDVDRISTKAHFHFIFKKLESKQKTAESVIQPSSQLSSGQKKSKIRVSGSQKAEQDVFFSFPIDQKKDNIDLRLIAKKQDASKTLYLQQGNDWIKVDEQQIQIINGDRLAAFLNPDTKQPSIYFQLKFEVFN